MPIANFILLADKKLEDKSYEVTIEEFGGIETRLNIRLTNDREETLNTQGVDLTGEECLAIGEHLIAVGKRILRE